MLGSTEGDAVETLLVEYSGTLLSRLVEIDVGSALGATVGSSVGISSCNDDDVDDDDNDDGVDDDVLGDDREGVELGRTLLMSDGSSLGSVIGSRVGDSDVNRLEGKHDGGGRLEISVIVMDCCMLGD